MVDTLGSTVRERRRDLGLRQVELAELAGVSVRFLNELENGKTTARLDKIVAVLDALGLTFDVRVRGSQQA